MGYEERVLIWMLMLMLMLCLRGMVYGKPQVPCYFIFGDSLVDNGNNNDLQTQAKANYPPNGIDFPEGPTGRFTNGRNIADVIAQLLGFHNYIPPFAKASGRDFLRGVNYGSGSSGILDETGQHLGARISLNQQIRNHQTTISKLNSIMGSKRLAKEHLNKCLYTVGMGSNDYINNYLLPQYYPSTCKYHPEEFADKLVIQYSRQLKTLYKCGARKIGIFGVGNLGCIPAEISSNGTNNSPCADKINDITKLFNPRLKILIDDLNTAHSDANFIFIDDSQLEHDGPQVKAEPCCQVSQTVMKGQCVMNSIPCSNRSDYVFWDAFHPTETLVLVTGANAYAAMVPLYAPSSSSAIDPRGSNLSQQI